MGLFVVDSVILTEKPARVLWKSKDRFGWIFQNEASYPMLQVIRMYNSTGTCLNRCIADCRRFRFRRLLHCGARILLRSALKIIMNRLRPSLTNGAWVTGALVAGMAAFPTYAYLGAIKDDPDATTSATGPSSLTHPGSLTEELGDQTSQRQLYLKTSVQNLLNHAHYQT